MLASWASSSCSIGSRAGRSRNVPTPSVDGLWHLWDQRPIERSVTRQVFTTEQARTIGQDIGIDWATSRFSVDEFRAGMDVELEHGVHQAGTNVTDDDPHLTAKIALAHLNEFPDYYTRLEAMEEEAKRYWSAHSG